MTRSGAYDQDRREAGLRSDRLKKDLKNQKERVRKAQKAELAAAVEVTQPTPPPTAPRRPRTQADDETGSADDGSSHGVDPDTEDEFEDAASGGHDSESEGGGTPPPVAIANALGELQQGPIMAEDFDVENGADPTDMVGKLHQITLEYDPGEVLSWINRLEIKMESYGIKAQWSKRIVLEANLPRLIQKDLSELLNKRKTAAGDSIYKECKTMLLALHGPKGDEDFQLAMDLVMTGTPSQAAKQLVQLICDKENMENCCCSMAVSCKWRSMLPTQVKAQVATLPMKTKAEFKAIIAAADLIFNSLKQTNPTAAIAPATGIKFAGDPAAAAAPVAAVGRGQGAARRPRGRGGGGWQGARGQGDHTNITSIIMKM